MDFKGTSPKRGRNIATKTHSWNPLDYFAIRTSVLSRNLPSDSIGAILAHSFSMLSQEDTMFLMTFATVGECQETYGNVPWNKRLASTAIGPNHINQFNITGDLALFFECKSRCGL
jgi:hypothetical protein